MDDVGSIERRLERLSGDLEGIVGRDHVSAPAYSPGQATLQGRYLMT